MPERRRYPRKEFVTKVNYFVITTPSGSGLIKNISEGGICMFVEKILLPSTILKLEFNLPEQNEAISIEAIGKVVWIKEVEGGYLVGVQFIG